VFGDDGRVNAPPMLLGERFERARLPGAPLRCNEGFAALAAEVREESAC